MLPAMCDHTSIWNAIPAFRISLFDQWMIRSDPHFWQELPKNMLCQDRSSSPPHVLGGWLKFNLQWLPPAAETQQILLGIQVLEKEPGHHSQLGRHRWTPELLSKASWQALTWRRQRERRNLKTPFPLSEQWAGNQSACQLLRCSCQAVVLLCRPGSTNYTFVFSPGPALLLPQLNTLKQGLLQLWELSWESGESQQAVDEGPTEKSGGYKPHGEGKLLPVVDRKQSIWYPDGWEKICRKEIEQLVEDGALWMDFLVAWPQPPTLLQQDAVTSTVGIRTDIYHSLLAQASPATWPRASNVLHLSLSHVATYTTSASDTDLCSAKGSSASKQYQTQGNLWQ